MSLNSKEEIWMELCRARSSNITEGQSYQLLIDAATAYYTNGNKDLVEMFDQYIMLKTLKGIENGNEKEKK